MEKIQQVIDSLIPAIALHGGSIELVKVENRIVYLKMLGACLGCPASEFTQKLVIEKMLKEKLPELVKQVVVVE